MKSFYLFATLVGVFFIQKTQTAASKSNDLDFGSALKMYYTSFQKIMPCGYSEFNIPVLAPFSLEHYDFNLTNDNYSIKGSVSRLSVTGFNNFRILGGSFNISTNRTTYDLIFPKIQTLGEYELDAEAVFAGFPLQFSGKGFINIKMVDYRIMGDFALTPSRINPNGIRISDFNSRFYMGNIICNNWNNLWDTAFNNFVNKLASEFTLMGIQEIQPQVNDIFNLYLLPNLNLMLSEVSMSNLTNFLVYQSKNFEAAKCSLD